MNAPMARWVSGGAGPRFGAVEDRRLGRCQSTTTNSQVCGRGVDEQVRGHRGDLERVLPGVSGRRVAPPVAVSQACRATVTGPLSEHSNVSGEPPLAVPVNVNVTVVAAASSAPAVAR